MSDAEVGGLLAVLASADRVRAVVGRFAAADADLRELAAEIARFVVVPEAPGVEAALNPLEGPDEAVVLLAGLASVDLLWPGPLMDAATARAAAERVVDALGGAATWWTNREDPHAVNRLRSGHLDVLVAGTDGTRFVVLVQSAAD